jgi:hypothetical protein
MAGRWLLLIAASLSLCSSAYAEEQLRFEGKHRLSCVLVRYYVAKYTAPAAEAYARSSGASDADIEAARRCLPRTLTAQAAP